MALTLTRADFLRLLGAGVALGGTAFGGTAFGGTARADALQTVTVGGVRLPTDAPLFIAMDKGYFAKEGIAIDVKWFTAAASVFSSVVSGDVDIGMTSATAATFNLASKGGFKIIAGSTRDAPHFPLNAFLVSNKAYAAGFTSFHKMEGKRLGMLTAGSTHQYDIAQLAQKYGIPLSDVAMVPLENYGNISAALQSGQVDGAILPPAIADRIVAAKGAHFLAWTGDEVPIQQGILFASPQTLAHKRDLVQRFLRAYVQGAQEYHRNFNMVDASGKPVKGPEFDALVAIIATHAGITPAQVEAQVTYIIADSRPDEADIRKQIAFWQQLGMVPKNVDFSHLFDLSFLPKS
jgi:NitT/TauT family transport system substrate-binding protein